MSIPMSLTAAMEALESGAVIYNRPQGYIGSYMALRGGTVYSHRHGWERCKKGVSTIIGGDWFTSDPNGRPVPEFEPLWYESESFLAHEQRKQAEQVTEVTKRLVSLERFMVTPDQMLELDRRMRAMESFIAEIDGEEADEER